MWALFYSSARATVRQASLRIARGGLWSAASPRTTSQYCKATTATEPFGTLEGSQGQLPALAFR